MAKKKSKKRTKKAPEKKEKPPTKVTLEAVAAMSDSDDEGIPEESRWNDKAKGLADAIKAGDFDHLIERMKPSFDGDGDDGSEMEEATLDSSGESEEGEKSSVEASKSGKKATKEPSDEEEGSGDSEEEEEEEMEVEKSGKTDEGEAASDDGSEQNEEEEEDEEEEEEEDDDDDSSDDEDTGGNAKMKQLRANNAQNSRAISVVTAELAAIHAKLPWAERFDVIPETPLPFGENGDPDANPLDVHDDLKREVAFYKLALEGVNEARKRCEKAGMSFSRPDDFFAEMVKTDDHMAKVKDRLIFENKKMEAVAQRKSNREHKLRAKESQANRLAEKSRRKKEHFQQVEEWANSVARNRGGALQDDVDDLYLGGRGGGRNNNGGPSKKRQAADRKFGHGGKKGRFKQNDRASMNDVSGFNPRGNFPGGMKRTAGGSGSSGSKRQGKRARDANRSRRG